MVLILPKGRSGRLLACTLTLAVPCLLFVLAVQPMSSAFTERNELLQRQAALLGRMERLAARLPALRRQAEASGVSASLDGSVLGQDTDATASAALQESLQSMFKAASVALSTVETLPGEDVGRYRRVRLRIGLTGQWPALVEVLRLIASAKPALFVDELQIKPALHRIGTYPGSFDVTLALFAFRGGTQTVAGVR